MRWVLAGVKEIAASVYVRPLIWLEDEYDGRSEVDAADDEVKDLKNHLRKATWVR